MGDKVTMDERQAQALRDAGWFDLKTGQEYGEKPYNFTGADFKRVLIWAKPTIYHIPPGAVSLNLCDIKTA